MEKGLIDAVGTGQQLAWVEVKANYNNTKIPEDATKKDNEEAAESRLGKVEWSYGPALNEGGTWKKSPKKNDPKQVVEASDAFEVTQ
jgi:hypothetical protein